jgi:hypothetical protein
MVSVLERRRENLWTDLDECALLARKSNSGLAKLATAGHTEVSFLQVNQRGVIDGFDQMPETRQALPLRAVPARPKK